MIRFQNTKMNKNQESNCHSMQDRGQWELREEEATKDHGTAGAGEGRWRRRVGILRPMGAHACTHMHIHIHTRTHTHTWTQETRTLGPGLDPGCVTSVSPGAAARPQRSVLRTKRPCSVGGVPGGVPRALGEEQGGLRHTRLCPDRERAPGHAAPPAGRRPAPPTHSASGRKAHSGKVGIPQFNSDDSLIQHRATCGAAFVLSA